MKSEMLIKNDVTKGCDSWKVLSNPELTMNLSPVVARRKMNLSLQVKQEGP